MQLRQTSSSDPISPVGQNGFGIESMREIATANGAINFSDIIKTDSSDYGVLLNPIETPNQFGVATYDMGDGFYITHSIADYIPAEMRSLVQLDTPSTPSDNERTLSQPAYVSILDITVPYQLPHAIVTPRLYAGFLARILNAPNYSGWKNDVEAVKLEGDFSDFIDAAVVKGEEKTAFLYLAPNIMEILLTKGINFTVEFIGNHIYIYYREPGASSIEGAGSNIAMTPEKHEQILRSGLEISNSLKRASRPVSQTSTQKVQIRRKGLREILSNSLRPFLFLLIPFIGVIFLIGALFNRWLAHSRRYKKYQNAYVRNR